jgi:hypothetical protein
MVLEINLTQIEFGVMSLVPKILMEITDNYESNQENHFYNNDLLLRKMH